MKRTTMTKRIQQMWSSLPAALWRQLLDPVGLPPPSGSNKCGRFFRATLWHQLLEPMGLPSPRGSNKCDRFFRATLWRFRATLWHQLLEPTGLPSPGGSNECDRFFITHGRGRITVVISSARRVRHCQQNRAKNGTGCIWKHACVWRGYGA